MKKMSIFLQFATVAVSFLAAPAFAEVVEIHQAQEEMAIFLEKFPDLSHCTPEEQEEALAFFQETQKVEALLRDASQAVENLNGEAAQNKLSEAAEILKSLSQ